MPTLNGQHTVLAEAESSPTTRCASIHQPCRALRAEPKAAASGAAPDPGGLDPAGGSAGPDRADRGEPRGPAGTTPADPGGPNGGFPYGFLRGTAVVMAEDVARLPSTGITPVVCGTRTWATSGSTPPGTRPGDRPERFRRGAPRRLGMGPASAGRQHLGRGPAERRVEEQLAVAVRSCVAAYRRNCAGWPTNHCSAARSPASTWTGSPARPPGRCNRKWSARRRGPQPTSDRALPRFTGEVDGQRRIIEEPPLITRLPDDEAEALAEALDDYLTTLSTHWRRVLGGYTPCSTSRRRWSGSAASSCARTSPCWKGPRPRTSSSCNSSRPGARCWRATCTANRPGTLTRGSASSNTSRRCRPSATPLLGWTTVQGRQFYVRQFRNMKGTIPLDAMDAAALIDYAGVVGQLLAKGTPAPAAPR